MCTIGHRANSGAAGTGAGGTAGDGGLDRVELLVADALQGARVSDRLTAGLTEEVMSRLPPRSEMRPALGRLVRLVFGLTAAYFSVAAWRGDVFAAFGSPEWAKSLGVALALTGAAMGALTAGVALASEARRGRGRLARSLAAAFAGRAGRTALGTAGAALLVAVTWVFLSRFPAYLLPGGVEAARASLKGLVVVLVAAAALQTYLARPAAGSPSPSRAAAMRLVEAGGLVAAGTVCAANLVLRVLVA
jgi:hypothetical protein